MTHLEVNERMCAYLRVCREKSGKTQRDLALELGFSTSQYISNVERAKCDASLDLLFIYIKLCNARPIRIVHLHSQHESIVISQKLGA